MQHLFSMIYKCSSFMSFKLKVNAVMRFAVTPISAVCCHIYLLFGAIE